MQGSLFFITISSVQEFEMKDQTFRWELIGTFFVIVFGTTLHFWFEWTGYWRPIVVIAAVNESTWEHFKMAFWPGFFWGIIEWFRWGRGRRNFWIAKFFGLLAMPLITMALFYGYTLFFHHNLPADIVVFILSIAGGQFISFLILIKNPLWPPLVKIIAIKWLILMVIAFATLSYFPREFFLFAHPETGEYGILSDYSDHNHDGGDEHDEHDDD